MERSRRSKIFPPRHFGQSSEKFRMHWTLHALPECKNCQWQEITYHMRCRMHSALFINLHEHWLKDRLCDQSARLPIKISIKTSPSLRSWLRLRASGRFIDKKFSCSDSFIYFLRMYVTKAIFSCDLRDFQYPFVCVTYFRIVGIMFRSATRHVLVESITRRENKSKDCRNIRIIEQVKRYG